MTKEQAWQDVLRRNENMARADDDAVLYIRKAAIRRLIYEAFEKGARVGISNSADLPELIRGLFN